MPSSSVSEDAKAVSWPRMFRWRARPSRPSCSSGWGLDDGTFIFQLRRSETWNNAMYRIWSIYGSSSFVVGRRQRLCQRLCPAFFHIAIATVASAWVLQSRHAESVGRFSSLCVTYQKHSPSERPDLLQLKPSLILTWKAGTGGMNPKIPWFFSWLAAKNLKKSTQSLVLGAYFNFFYWGGIPSRRSLKSLASTNHENVPTLPLSYLWFPPNQPGMHPWFGTPGW